MQLTEIFCYNRPYCGLFDSFFAVTGEGGEDGCAGSATHEERRKRRLDSIGKHYWLVGIFIHERGNEMLKLCRNLYTTFRVFLRRESKRPIWFTPSFCKLYMAKQHINVGKKPKKEHKDGN